jgi:hypothetical protein
VPQLPRDEDDEERGQGPVGDDRIGILEKACEPVLPGEEQQAPARIWVEVSQPYALVVDEEDR